MRNKGNGYDFHQIMGVHKFDKFVNSIESRSGLRGHSADRCQAPVVATLATDISEVIMLAENIFRFFYFFTFVTLPGYALPVLGTYISIRPYAKHWWPTLPELQLILLPIILYAFLMAVEDRQGFSIGLPSLIIAVPVMITLWLGPTEENFWVAIEQNPNYWIGFGCSMLTAVIVYALYPKTNLGF